MPRHMVLDASVAVKWFIPENDTDLANDILLAFLADELVLHAPQIIRYEVCSALAKACLGRVSDTKANRMQKKQAIQCVGKFFSLPIQIHDVAASQARGSLEMAVDFHKSYYDMIYVSLARHLDCQWCTADNRVLHAVPDHFPRDRVLLLSKLQKQ